MAILKVQFQRSLAGAPSIGKWDLYSSAFFDAPLAAPSLTIRNLIQRMFMLLPASGTDNLLYTDQLNSGAASVNLKTWEWSGGVLTAFSDHDDSLVTNPSGSGVALRLPLQSTIALGYSATVVGPRQRGKTRWWHGPVMSRASNFQERAGGLCLTTASVPFITSNVKACIDALAALSWVLQVKSGPLLTATFEPCDEILMTDMLGCMRSRHSWSLTESRRTI